MISSLLFTRQNLPRSITKLHIECQYTFTGRQLDPESGLYHFHFRQYDPTSGVWTTADPIGILGGLNLYTYIQNNPVNFRDFLGLSEISDVNGGYADNGGLGYNGGNDFDGGGGSTGEVFSGIRAFFIDAKEFISSLLDRIPGVGVLNLTDKNLTVKPGINLKKAVSLPPYSIYWGAIDALTIPNKCGAMDVYKVTGPFSFNNVVTDLFDYDPFGPDSLNEILGGGIKNNNWLNEQQSNKDRGWDAIFNEAPSSGECSK